MPLTQKIKNVATNAKKFVIEHKQTVFNTVMLVGLSGVSAAVIYLTRETKELGKDDAFLYGRIDYGRGRIYNIERQAGMPVHKDDQRHHDYLEALSAEPTDQ